MVISNLFGVIGLVFTLHTSPTILIIEETLPTLAFYARVLFAYKNQNIRTVCVAFNGMAAPFWFGSTLGKSQTCGKIRLKELEQALALFNPKIVLPLVPPCDQTQYGSFIRNKIVFDILEKQGIQDKTVEKKVGKSYVKLLQAITEPVPEIEPEKGKEEGPDAGKKKSKEKKGVEQPAGPDEERKEEEKAAEKPAKPKGGEAKDSEARKQWRFVTTEPPGFSACVDEIIGDIFKGQEIDNQKATQVKNTFSYSHVYKLVKDQNTKQQYGHCAETYPLIFLLRSVFIVPPSPVIGLR